MTIQDLIISSTGGERLADVVLDVQSRQAIASLIKEHRHAPALLKYGLPVVNKLLLHGASGCGKTMTAKAIATAMGRPLLILNLSQIVSSRIGETALNLKLVFDKAAREAAVLFLDELDQIGKARSKDDRDVGEMRRLVNTLIQLLDYHPATSLLIGATNHPEIIDGAILRRFQVKIGYELPGSDQLDRYYDELLRSLPPQHREIPRRYGISFAEARDYAFILVKQALIEEWESATGSEGA
jgi:SpoVK/Ycf46/Vps4 family AAA+-type ATPase